MTYHKYDIYDSHDTIDIPQTHHDIGLRTQILPVTHNTMSALQLGHGDCSLNCSLCALVWLSESILVPVVGNVND
ncbi:hypothetical protein PAXRUDRAFT_643624 [Paxillus rubicundulus Ve08.2h10]|uniref:Uncharacterized protein n=1 Tax=Paxillus rubicundulus Ve08.2h10 TaxID=930991 RepID=A0A0D0E2Q3_9AGAM|nr:hypothetical protein PAXRUDRAFT_643624 [Paxillus rubicundulus Ve08.2h10]